MASNQSMIVTGVRTPMGAFMGALAGVPAAQLGATCVKALLERTGVPADRVDDVIMGTCIAAGQGMNPARQVAIFGGLAQSTHAVTINEACASGMRAVMLADQLIRVGDAGLVVAGGMENMSRPPYLLLKAREGYRLGNSEVMDALMYDGSDRCLQQQADGQLRRPVRHQVRHHPAAAGRLRGREPRPRPQGRRRQGLRRRDRPGLDHRQGQDDDGQRGRGVEQVRRGEDARPAGRPSTPTGPSPRATPRASTTGPRRSWWPRRRSARRSNLKPRARIVGAVIHSQEPEWFTTAPVGAVKKLLDKVGWGVSGVDLFEVNEAFAVVAAGRAARNWACRPRRPTSTAAPSRWATRSAAAVRGSWSRS